MKAFFLAIPFVLIAYVSCAQTTFGIKTGLNLSKAVYLEKDIDELVKPYRKLKPGIAAGFCIIQRLNPVMKVEADILYSQKGLKFIQEPFRKTINSMNYLELPISGQLKVTGNKTASLYGELGGFAAFWLYGKYIYTDLATEQTSAVNVDFKDAYFQYSRIDYGILAGLMLDLKKASLSLRYTHSLSGSSELNVDAVSNKVFTTSLIIKIMK
jgi:hypothetical protein